MPKSAAELQAAYQRLDANFRRELTLLALVAYGKERPKLGKMAQSWQPERPATGSPLFVAPDQYGGQAELARPAEPSDATRQWLEEFTKLARCQQADALVVLAREAADAGQLSLAIEWATEAVRDNPDQAEARHVLGYELVDGQWLTSYAKRMVESGKVWHSKYGWIAKEDLPHYQAGERPSGNRWIPAQRDARRHDRQDEDWQVRTDHFLVTANDSLEAAAGTGRAARAAVPGVAAIVRRVLLCRTAKCADLFAGDRESRPRSRPFRVFYYRDRSRLRGGARAIASRGSPKRWASISTPTARPTSLPATSRTRQRYITRRSTSCFKKRTGGTARGRQGEFLDHRRHRHVF